MTATRLQMLPGWRLREKNMTFKKRKSTHKMQVLIMNLLEIIRGEQDAVISVEHFGI